MTLFSNYTNFGTITLLILGLTLFALLCPWRNLPTNLDTLLKSLWRLSGPVAVTWAIFVLVLIGTTAYAILLLIHHLGTVGTNKDHLRQIILAIPVLIAALAGLIALPVTLIRLHYTRRQTLAEEEGLITDRINAAVLGLGAEKTVKFEDSDRKIVERTVANIEVRIGSLLALGRLAPNNLDVHVQIMQILVSYINANAIVLRSVSQTTRSSPAPFTSSNTRLDVQTAFDVIGDRTADQVDQEKIERADKPSTAFVIRNALLIGVNLDDKNLSNLKFVDCDFAGAHIGTDLSDTEFVQCDLFHASGIFLGKAKVVAKCLIKGSSMQLKYALNPYELVNNFVSGTIANLSLEVNLEQPSHWMHEGTPYTVLKDAWEAWLLA